ncbi:hypothetical protein [Streptomyces sp. NPDC051014]|uniref:hypothetical protein n=1 Tax=Streptomyces sp. NPDC051014 TaxID=3155751 RepID=UPI0033C62DB5
MRSKFIEAGHCSACLAAAERGRSGAWWHAGTACDHAAARFTPGPAPDGGAERQQQSPRDRQIRHPRRDR